MPAFIKILRCFLATAVLLSAQNTGPTTLSITNNTAGGGSSIITCGGTDDTAAIVAASPNIVLPSIGSCAANALNLPAGSRLMSQGATLKWITGNTGNLITESNSRVTFENLTIDLNGNLPAGASGGIFFNGGDQFTLKNVHVISTGSPAMLNPAVSTYNAGGLINGLYVENTVKGTHLFIAPNKRSDRKILVDGFYSDGSNRNAIAVQNSGSEGPANVEITHFYIANVTDTNGGTGQQGNAIDTFWADGVTVHDGQAVNTRFSSVRFATSYGNKAYSIKSTGTQETAYYAELGGWGNEFYDLTIENGVSGLNMTNVSQRPNYPLDSPNVAHNIVCRNLTDYCIKSEHDQVRTVLIDGVPIGIAHGYGSTTGNNIVRDVVCTRTSTAYPNVDVCEAIDANINPAAVDIASGIVSSNYTPLIATVYGASLSSGNNITGITQANPAVITYTGGVQPAANAKICLRAVGGMTQMNGLCTIVASSTGTTITTAIDSSTFSAFVSPTGGQKSWTMQFLNSGGTAQYAIPSNVTVSN